MPPKKASKPPAKRPAARKAAPTRKSASGAKPKRASPAKPKKASAAAKPKAKAEKTQRPAAVRAAKAQPKPAAKPPARKPIPLPPPKPKPKRPVIVHLGDELLFPAPLRFGETGSPGQGRGIVCSIRDIRTGMAVGVATGDMTQYVFEVINDQTFAPGVSSPANSDSLAARRRVQELLRRMARQKQVRGLGEAALAETGLAGLDGWRIVKVHSADIENVEPPAALPTKKAKRA